MPRGPSVPAGRDVVRPRTAAEGAARGWRLSELVRRGLGGGDERPQDPGARWQHQHPAQDRVDLVEPVLQSCHGPEVPASATERPEEIGVPLKSTSRCSPSAVTSSMPSRSSI